MSDAASCKPDIHLRLRLIRDILTSQYPDVQFGGDSKIISQFGTALYVVEDCECAIGAYETMQWPREVGGQYLAVYGVLQAMFVQQDAVQALYEAIDEKFEFSHELVRIRHARNRCIGHPAKDTQGGKRAKDTQGGKRAVDHHMIIQVTLSHAGFRTQSMNEPHGIRQGSVNLREMISTQRSIVDSALDKLLPAVNRAQRRSIAGTKSSAPQK
jgi:hypothetical protein